MREFYKTVYGIGLKFFDQIIKMYKENQYDYIVMTTRRCFCLFFALYEDPNFISNFDADDKNILTEIHNKTISSQKVNIIGKNFCDKKVLLLDDVMIHGHAVYNIYETIKNNLNKGRIDTLVAVRNAEYPDFYFQMTKRKYNFIIKEIPVKWRHISNCIVRYLHEQSQCYTSYIYGIKTPKEIAENATATMEKMCVNYNNLETYTEFNEYPDYFIDKSCDIYSFVDVAMIRVYCVPDSKDCMVVPYVLLKEISIDNINKIWSALCDLKSVKQQFESIKTPEDKYKALSAICGITLYKKYFPLIDNFENIIDKSFVPSFLKTVYETFEYQDVFDNIKKFYSGVTTKREQTLMENDLMKAFIKTEITSTADFLKTYLYLVTEEEELLYKSDLDFEYNAHNDYMNSIFFSLFLEIAEPFLQKISGYNIDIIKSEMMFLADIGSLSFVVRKNNDYVGTCVKTGEQSYKLFVDIAKNAYKAIYIILNYIINNSSKMLQENLMKKIEENYQKFAMSSEHINTLRFFVENPPYNLEEHYYGPLDMISKYKSKDDKREADIILKNAIDLMTYCCGKNFVI